MAESAIKFGATTEVHGSAVAVTAVTSLNSARFQLRCDGKTAV
jgi:hypothetical protein